MIYVTGDTHGFAERFTPDSEYFINDESFTKDDILIITGDFGFVFYDDKEEEDKLDFLATKPYTICFADGNHENFKKLYTYPEEEWCGGKIHKVRDNVYHLMRGYVFSLQDKKFFVMGGAYSIDRMGRTLDISYWKEELPNDIEYKTAVENLKQHNFEVDYIITHTAPKEIVMKMGFCPDVHEVEFLGFLEYIMYEAKFKHWYFGHWHEDFTIFDKFTALLYDVKAIE